MRRVTLMLAAMALALLLASGVALAVTRIGGPGPDVLRGTNDRDRLEGRAGADTLLGLGAADCLAGGTGSDAVEGGRGNDLVLGGPQGCNRPPQQERPGAHDVVSGGPGDDIVDGAAGADSISGGDGNDFLADGENHGGATDILRGGNGNDFLWPRNEPAGRDVVKCGSGRDQVFADRKDVISDDCERVRHRQPTQEELNQFFS